MQTERPPYEAYAAIAGTLVAGLGAVAALSRRSPPASALDLVALSAATFKASRTLSREKVASFRQPFVEGEAELGEEERPAGGGFSGRSASSFSARAASGRGARRPSLRARC